MIRAAAGTGLVCLAGCSGDGEEGVLETTTTTVMTDDFTVSSSAFDDGGTIPEKYTAGGEDVSPPLTFEGLPDGTQTIALIVDDPDAPGGSFVHWLLWNLPADTTQLPEGVERTETLSELGGARQGTNGFGEIGYRGPAPPEGDEAHTYRFTAYAVDRTLDLEAGADRDALEDALSDATVGTARITGQYGVTVTTEGE